VLSLFTYIEPERNIWVRSPGASYNYAAMIVKKVIHQDIPPFNNTQQGVVSEQAVNGLNVFVYVHPAVWVDSAIFN